MNDHTSDIPQQEPHDSTGNPVASKKSKRKKTIAVVLVVIVLVTVGVVLAVTLNTHPDVVGSYKGDDGREIILAKDGTFTDITKPVWGLTAKGPVHYWVNGNKITIGDSKSRPKGPPTFKVEGNNRLVGYGTAWVKQLVEPNRPSSLVGTYVSGDGTSLILAKNGTAIEGEYAPSATSLATYGVWVAGNNTITVTSPDFQMNYTLHTTYAINGKDLVGEDKTLVKKSNDALPPITK